MRANISSSIADPDPGPDPLCFATLGGGAGEKRYEQTATMSDLYIKETVRPTICYLARKFGADSCRKAPYQRAG